MWCSDKRRDKYTKLLQTCLQFTLSPTQLCFSVPILFDWKKPSFRKVCVLSHKNKKKLNRISSKIDSLVFYSPFYFLRDSHDPVPILFHSLNFFARKLFPQSGIRLAAIKFQNLFHPQKIKNPLR